ncbi:ATP-binding cassette sub-family G member 4-like [Aricia agestis]|uniref:ATP-binding cassette sub-family G member 4-like n=1 Tax=Aricia agestis TaxID=91739 RepID=UPI001C204DC2|nr:ATP-binding cassette sub-family G member 4-like [Aricia agestis]
MVKMENKMSGDNNIVQIDEKDKVCVEFENISYILNQFNFRTLRLDKKEILQGVSGCFKSGELTGIIGPSGAGKTTLLNILAGYSTLGAMGTIRINGTPLSATQSVIRAGTRYIRQQDDNMRSYLTLYEAMHFAAALKLPHLTTMERHRKIIDILIDLNIYQSQRTLIGKLSGGEKRRLAVSLELLSDPALMFIDEPTTGLDSCAATSLLEVLCKLAKGGRTIVATIQQPSAMLLEKFDSIYCLANGKTLYDGPRENLIPAFNYADLCCPAYYNPADFLIEIACTETRARLDKAATEMAKYNQNCAENNSSNNNYISSKCSKKEHKEAPKAENEASSLRQTLILTRRTFVIATRTFKSFLLRIFAYVIISFLIGKVYYMNGSDAATVFGNGSAIYSCAIFLIYAALMYVTLSSQLEIEVVKIEHFNQWYRLGPHMVSFLSVELLFQIVITTISSVICYWQTGNPIEGERMTLYVAAMMLMSVCGASWGFFLGSTVPIKLAVFIGPSMTCVYSLFAFSLPLKYTPYPFRWLYHTSYFRAGCHIAVNAIYGNRGKLPCSKVYCHYMSPKNFLTEFDVTPIDITSNFALIVFTTILLYFLTFCTLYYKLNKR